MNNYFSAFIFVTLSFAGLQGQAQRILPAPVIPETIVFQGVDVKPVVQFFSPLIKSLGNSFFVYNWSRDNQRRTWGHTRTSSDPLAYQTLLVNSTAFWRNYGVASDNTYGYGLYAAIDPVSTRDFGGTMPSDFWVLFQMQLPQGFRYLDISGEAAQGNLNVSGDVGNIFNHFRCDIAGEVKFFGLFAGSGTSPSSQCAQLLKFVLNDTLLVDGFFYSYPSQAFSACPSFGPESKALVITNSRWASQDAVRVFTRNTTGDLNARLVIQSTFLRATSGAYVSQITDDDQILWRDLIGRPTVSNIDQWMQQNLFECQRN